MRVGAALGAAVLAMALLAGCGGGGATGTKGAAPAPRVPAEVAIEAGASGFDATRIYRDVAPGVVTIRSVFGSAPGGAEGSGFVLDADGEIVTNAHVVTEAAAKGGRTPASEVFVEFSNRNVLEARIVGFDPFADVALLKVEPEGFALHPLRLGNDAALMVGEPVAAIGSPFGEQRSLSVGVVSATDRSVNSLTQFQIASAIQTDASINPGNSGGPLLEAAGKVIGIDQQIETNSGANDGVGFAVPISAVKHSLAMLRADGQAEYAYLGVSSQALYPQLAAKLGLDTEFGALIARVLPGGPAAKAGLRGADGTIKFQAAEYETGGDVIVEAEGREVVQPDALARAVAARQPGEKLDLTVLRDGRRRSIAVTLGKRPDRVAPE